LADEISFEQHVEFVVTHVNSAVTNAAAAEVRLQEQKKALEEVEKEAQKRILEAQKRAPALVKPWLTRHGYRDANEPKQTFARHTKFPLHTAVKYKEVEIIKLLLLCGADKHAKDSKGRCPRDVAVQMKQEKGQCWRQEMMSML